LSLSCGTLLSISALLIGRSPAVPLVIGTKLTDAEVGVRKDGFKVASRSEEAFDAPSGQVISQIPKAGTSAKKDSVVLLS
jgi:beta-lactam-binding protein with PASTA domain